MSEATQLPPPVIPGFEHVRRYWHSRQQSFVAKVLPGEYYVTCGGELLFTVLGSCVSACIRDPQARVGGMNHFMLPDWGHEGRWDLTHVDRAHRYGTYAMEHMINDILKHGGRRERLEIKLVGGGRVLENMTNVGARNIEFVRDYLQKEGLTVHGEDLGDVHPRKVYYDVITGRMRVKKLSRRAGESVVLEERSYQRAIQARSVSGEVELF